MKQTILTLVALMSVGFNQAQAIENGSYMCETYIEFIDSLDGEVYSEKTERMTLDFSLNDQILRVFEDDEAEGLYALNQGWLKDQSSLEGEEQIYKIVRDDKGFVAEFSEAELDTITGEPINIELSYYAELNLSVAEDESIMLIFKNDDPEFNESQTLVWECFRQN